MRLVGRRADVEDLVQATFLEVMSAAARFRGDAQVSTWLVAIAANLARQQLRAGRRLSHDAGRPPPLQTRSIRYSAAVSFGSGLSLSRTSNIAR